MMVARGLLFLLLAISSLAYDCNKSCQYCCSNNVCVQKSECTKIILYILIGVIMVVLIIGGLIVTTCWLKFKDNKESLQSVVNELTSHIRKNPSRYTEIKEEKDNDIQQIYSSHDTRHLSHYDKQKLETLAVSQTYQRYRVGESFEDRNSLVSKYNMTFDTMKSLPTMTFSVGRRKFRVSTLEDIKSVPKKQSHIEYKGATNRIVPVSLIQYSTTLAHERNNENNIELNRNPLDTSIDELYSNLNNKDRNRNIRRNPRGATITNESRHASHRGLKDGWTREEVNIGVNSTNTNRSIEAVKNLNIHEINNYNDRSILRVGRKNEERSYSRIQAIDRSLTPPE